MNIIPKLLGIIFGISALIKIIFISNFGFSTDLPFWAVYLSCAASYVWIIFALLLFRQNRFAIHAFGIAIAFQYLINPWIGYMVNKTIGVDVSFFNYEESVRQVVRSISVYEFALYVAVLFWLGWCTKQKAFLVSAQHFQVKITQQLVRWRSILWWGYFVLLCCMSVMGIISISLLTARGKLDQPPLLFFFATMLNILGIVGLWGYIRGKAIGVRYLWVTCFVLTVMQFVFVELLFLSVIVLYGVDRPEGRVTLLGGSGGLLAIPLIFALWSYSNRSSELWARNAR